LLSRIHRNPAPLRQGILTSAMRMTARGVRGRKTPGSETSSLSPCGHRWLVWGSTPRCIHWASREADRGAARLSEFCAKYGAELSDASRHIRGHSVASCRLKRNIVMLYNASRVET